MSGPTTRVLALLELLQARGRLSGAEIAERLSVDRRTVRRYIRVLEDLGIPVTTEQGRYGGYALVPGFKLPPLMFNEAEVRAITLALLALRESDLLGGDTAVESVQAKLERVMPTHLKAQVNALVESTQLIPPRRQTQQHTHLLPLTQAVHTRCTVRMVYQSPKGEAMPRQLDPYGLAFRAGYWYVSGYCHLRRELRSFRLDRLADITLLDTHFERPTHFNAAEHLMDSLRKAQYALPASVLLLTDVANFSRCFAEIETLLEQHDDGLLLTTTTSSYPWFVSWLVQLPFEFRILGPEALKTAFREHLARLSNAVAGP